MRSTIATLAVVVGVAAFASTAGTAAADDPNAKFFHEALLGGGESHRCETPRKPGVLGEYGAWGYYIDGCTAGLLTCKFTTCRASSNTGFYVLIRRGDRVTQNARLRWFNTVGQLTGSRDRSCSGIDSCNTGFDHVDLSAGQKASVQCNGVREAKPLPNDAVNRCYVEMVPRT